jgi:hypothetical protein
MADVFILGPRSELESLSIDDSPEDAGYCLSAGPIDRESRAVLYAQLSGLFIDDALVHEQYDHAIGDEGPYLFGLSDEMRDLIADIDDDQNDVIVGDWLMAEPMTRHELELVDLSQFLFDLSHFCQLSRQSPEIGVFILSEG